ncbi:MAG: hypothetical protein RLZZ292_3240 [Bacteroidota bacterium]|jgi:hypothetical protein
MQDDILDSEIRLDNKHNPEALRILNQNQFLLLSITTLGLYDLWWMYKSWKFFKEKRGFWQILPAARAIFGIFYLHSLFEKILSFAKLKGYEKDYFSVALFIGYFIGSFAANIPNHWGLLAGVKVLLLLPAFNALNFAQQNSSEFDTYEQTSFSPRQIILIMVGLLLWAGNLMGE